MRQCFTARGWKTCLHRQSTFQITAPQLYFCISSSTNVIILAMAPDTFDELLTYLGTGWWNVLYIAALSFRLMLLPSQSISVVYLAPWQDHICIPDPAYMNITVSREACHYVIEKKLAKVGSDDREGGDGEARELVEMPCTQWDFNTTTFTSTLTSEFGWVCEREHLRAVYQSVYMLSTAVTPLLSGFLADRFGRLKVLVASHVALSVTSISICFLHSAPLIFLLRFFSGSSELLTGLVLTLEVCEQRHRAAVGVLTGLAWSAGTMLWGGLAFFIREWRALQLVASLPTLIAFPLLYFMDESPRWLIVRGQYKRASQVLKKAARWNKKTLPPQDQLNDLFVRICREGTEEKRGSKEYIKKTQRDKDEILSPQHEAPVLRKHNIRRPRLCWNKNIALITIINCLCFFCVALVFDGLNLAGDLYSDNVFLYLILGGLVEVPGILFAAPLIHHLGRKGPFVATLLGCGLVNIALSFIPTVHLTLSLVVAMVGKLLVGAAFQILYVYSNELFPTEVRVSGVEGAGSVGQVGALVAPYLSTYLGPLFPWLPSTVYGALSIMTACAALLLHESKDRPLPETIADLDSPAKKNRGLRTERSGDNTREQEWKLSDITT